LSERIENEARGEAQGTDIDSLQKDYQRNKETVVDLLVKNVLAVNIEIPKVVKGEFQ
jgi:hypothetical protein